MTKMRLIVFTLFLATAMTAAVAIAGPTTQPTPSITAAEQQACFYKAKLYNWTPERLKSCLETGV